MSLFWNKKKMKHLWIRDTDSLPKETNNSQCLNNKNTEYVCNCQAAENNLLIICPYGLTFWNAKHLQLLLKASWAASTLWPVLTGDYFLNVYFISIIWLFHNKSNLLTQTGKETCKWWSSQKRASKIYLTVLCNLYKQCI